MKTKQVIIGLYDDENQFISALKKVQGEGISVHDVFTPYPVHEVFKVLKLKTGMPIATFVYALIGFSMIYYYLYYSAVISYPLIYGGKPPHSIPSFIIIAFVSMISFAVLMSFITFLFRTKMYPGKRPNTVEPRSTNDAFVIVLDKSDSQKRDNEILELLKEAGAFEITEKEISV